MRTFTVPALGKRFVIGVPSVWLGLFFLLPFLILLYISFVDMGSDIHPFKPIWDSTTGLLVHTGTVSSGSEPATIAVVGY